MESDDELEHQLEALEARLAESSASIRRSEDGSSPSEDLGATLGERLLPSASSPATDNEGEELLDEDIDWDAVFDRAAQMRLDNGLSQPSSVGAENSTASAQGRRHLAPALSRASAPSTVVLGKDLRLRPYKTFFQIEEMLEAKAELYQNQPEMTLELFARVLYSSRENFIRRQYFQFCNLLTEGPPYLCGALQD